MAQEPASTTTQGDIPEITIDTTQPKKNEKIVKEEAAEFLKEIQEKAGQISESEMEEEKLVKEFFSSLLTILKSFSKTIEISISSLPESYNEQVSKAYLYLTGQLVLVSENREVKILNLADKENYELLVEITGEIMAKLKSIIDSHKLRIEKRVKFLMSITQELQRVARVFSEE